jgi:CheY-like chemotaxis protein
MQSKSIKTLLILDDEDDIAQLIANELQSEAKIVHFTRADQFLAYLNRKEFDAESCMALIDIILGQDNEGGFEVANQLSERKMPIPFIFISHSRLTENIIRSAEIGSHAFINKMRLVANPDELRAALAQAEGAHIRRMREQRTVSAKANFDNAEWTITSADFTSVFISYGAPDEGFAELLNDALNSHGVKTFFFKKHAMPGQKLHHMMRDGVNQNGRVVLIGSQSSLNRVGVLNEIEEALQREAREGGKSILIPITIDDYVFKDWAPKHPGIAQAIRDRVVADFRGAAKDPKLFTIALNRLLIALKA